MNELEPVWNAILDVYKEFARICDEQGLRYYVSYGTALGAVRHKGFIPWDDDFDVIMPRDDYERFRKIQETALPDHLKYVDWHNTKEMTSFTYAKIQDCRADHVADVETQIKRVMPHGIYMDIFPLDGAPGSNFAKSVWKLRLRLLRLAAASLDSDFPEKPTLRRRAGRLLGGFLRRHVYHAAEKFHFAKYYEAMVREKPYSPRYKCGCILSAYGSFYGLCDYSVYGAPTMMPFEGIQVPVPHEYDIYLTTLYGDYMTLPPIGKRISTHKDMASAPWKFGPTGSGDDK